MLRLYFSQRHWLQTLTCISFLQTSPIEAIESRYALYVADSENLGTHELKSHGNKNHAQDFKIGTGDSSQQKDF